MIDSVPLIQNPNDAQQINASIIALKRASRELDEKIAQFNKLLSQEITNREKAITEAINSLDVPSVGGSGKYISAISETDGKISATEGEITSTVSSGNSQPVTSGGVAEALNNIPYSKYSRLDVNANMNDCTDTGVLYFSSSTADISTFINRPTFTNAGEMSLITILLGSNKQLMQLYFAKDGAKSSIAKRVYNWNSWTSWERVDTLKEKQIRIDDSSGYSLYHGVYVKSIAGFFANNGIDYSKVVNIRQVNNGNDLYPYFFIAYSGGDVLKVFKFNSSDNIYVDIKVYYYD